MRRRQGGAAPCRGCSTRRRGLCGAAVLGSGGLRRCSWRRGRGQGDRLFRRRGCGSAVVPGPIWAPMGLAGRGRTALFRRRLGEGLLHPFLERGMLSSVLYAPAVRPLIPAPGVPSVARRCSASARTSSLQALCSSPWLRLWMARWTSWSEGSGYSTPNEGSIRPWLEPASMTPVGVVSS